MMSEGTKNIVEAMKARGISKVIGCMSGTPRCVKKKEVEELIEVCATNHFSHLFSSQPSFCGIAPKCRHVWFL